MISSRVGMHNVPENPLGLSWHDSSWIPLINPTNIMDYFSERSNPFYDRTCNNEIIKMQRLSIDQLRNMTGLEYMVLHVQEPILYVIRKQHRHSMEQTTPIADYYIIAGVVYMAPDLASVISSRMLSTVHHLQSALDEVTSMSRYNPSKGYTWDPKMLPQGKETVKKEVVKEEPSSIFQRQRVDMLLSELTRHFPVPQQSTQEIKPEKAGNESKSNTEVTQSPSMKPPPEKKPNIKPDRS